MSRRLRLFVVAIAALILIVGAIVWIGVDKARTKQEMEARLATLQRAADAGAAGRSVCREIVPAAEQDLPKLEAAEGGSVDVRKSYRALGDCQMQLGRYPQAVEAYGKVVFFDPEQARAHGDLARAYSRAGKASDAARHARLAVQLAPNSWQAHRVLARVLESNGQWANALASMRKAAALAPADQQHGAQQAIARLQARLDGSASATASQDGEEDE